MKQQINPILSLTVSRIRTLLQQYQEADAIVHAATKGALREAYLKQFLSDMIPTPLRVSGGFVTDSCGSDVSPQIDLLVFDPTNIPASSLSEFVTLVPIEAAVLAIEVKTSLENGDVVQIQRQQASFRKLQLAYCTEDRRYLTTGVCVGLPTIVVAFSAKCAQENFAKWFEDESQLQAICVVGRFTMLRDPNTGEVSTHASDERHAETLHLVAFVHGLSAVCSRQGACRIGESTPDGPRDFYPDLGAYLTFDSPKR